MAGRELPAVELDETERAIVGKLLRTVLTQPRVKQLPAPCGMPGTRLQRRATELEARLDDAQGLCPSHIRRVGLPRCEP
jgi:hypothetical protein